MSKNPLHAFLRPFEIALDLLCSFRAIGEIRTSALQSTLGQGLQFCELALLGVQLSRSVVPCQSIYSSVANAPSMQAIGKKDP